MAGGAPYIPPAFRHESGGVDPRSVPPGWDENPTAWPKRIGLVLVALLGLLVAGYLTLYQLEVFDGVWDPFFDSSTVLHLTEPFPDAALGVLAYGTEIVLSFIGGRSRWRTMPWTVIGFGAVIFFGAFVSIGLMILQPLIAGAWCTLCLASAAISLYICGWGADEPLAALQHLRRVKESGGSAWRGFWGLENTGYLMDGVTQDVTQKTQKTQKGGA